MSSVTNTSARSAGSNTGGTGPRTGKSVGSSGTAAGNTYGRAVCSFWLDDRRLGLDVSLVAEITAVDSVTPVPLTNPAVVGIFNLRGLPVPAVELGPVLGFERTASPRSHKAHHIAIVLRDTDLVVGVLVDRLDAVVAAGDGRFTAPSDQEQSSLVMGFLERGVEGESVVTVLDTAALMDRLRAVGILATKDD